MNELKCQFANHQKKKIITICLHKDCKDKRLCCLRCVSQFHGDHDDKLIEVQQFNDFIKNLSNQGVQASQSYTYAQNQLIQDLEYQISNIRQSELSLMKIIQLFDVPFNPKQLSFNKTPIELREHENKVRQAIISEDGALIVSSSNDKTIKIWNVKSKQILQRIQLTEFAYRIALSSNNQYLAYYFNQGKDSKIHLYGIKQNKHFGALNTDRIYRIESIVFSLDAKYILAGGNDKKIIFWCLITKKEVHIFETDRQIQMINISSDNKLISCLAGFKGTIYIWDLQTKAKLIQENYVHEFGYSLCSSADSSIYVTSGSKGQVKIWKLNPPIFVQFPKSENGAQHLHQSNPHAMQDNKYSLTLTLQILAGSSYVRALLTMDNQFIISMCNNDGTIMIYERESGQLIQELCSGEKSELISSISISNDMKVLVSTNFTNNIKVWRRE